MAVDQGLVLVDHPQLRQGPRILSSLCWARLLHCSPTQTQTLVYSLEHPPTSTWNGQPTPPGGLSPGSEGTKGSRKQLVPTSRAGLGEVA